MYENLQAFIRTVELGSFSKAGKELSLSPVAVMKRVNSLEAQVGVPLLERTSKGAAPNAAGKVVYEDGKRIVKETQAMTGKAREAATLTPSAVRISTPYIGSIRLFSDLWGRAGRAAERFTIEVVPIGIKHDTTDKVYELLDKVIDFTLSPFNAQRYPQLRGLKLAELTLCIAVGKGNPLACRRSVTVDELNVDRISMVTEGRSPGIDAVRRLIRDRRPDIEIVDDEGDYSMEAYVHYCREGVATIAPEGYADLQPSIATVPLEPRMPLPIHLVGTAFGWSRHAAFVEALRSVVEQDVQS